MQNSGNTLPHDTAVSNVPTGILPEKEFSYTENRTKEIETYV